MKEQLVELLGAMVSMLNEEERKEFFEKNPEAREFLLDKVDTFVVEENPQEK